MKTRRYLRLGLNSKQNKATNNNIGNKVAVEILKME